MTKRFVTGGYKIYDTYKDDEYLAAHFQVSMECVLTRKVKVQRRNKYKRMKLNE